MSSEEGSPRPRVHFRVVERSIRGGRHRIDCSGKMGLRYPLRSPNRAARLHELQDLELTRLFALLGVAPRLLAFYQDPHLGPISLIEMYPLDWRGLVAHVQTLDTGAQELGRALATQVTQQLKLVAELGFALLDMKPLNIVVSLDESLKVRLIDFETDFTTSHRENQEAFGTDGFFCQCSFLLMLMLLLLHFQRQARSLARGCPSLLAFLHGGFEVFSQELRHHLDLDLRRLARVFDARPPLLTKLTRVLGCYQMLKIPKEKHLRRRHEAADRVIEWLRRLQGSSQSAAPLTQGLDGDFRRAVFVPALPPCHDALELLQRKGCALLKSVNLPLELSMGSELLVQMNWETINAHDKEQLRCWGVRADQIS